MKSHHYLFAITCFLFASSFCIKGIDDQVLVFSKVLEIEAVQKVISENGYSIDSNGLFEHGIEAYIDDTPVVVADLQPDDSDPLTIERYDIKPESARVLMTKQHVKVRVKLLKNEGEWEIASYYIKNGKSISVSVEF